MDAATARTTSPNERRLVWCARVLWATLVVTAAPVVGGALADRSRGVQVVGTTLAWSVWAVVLVALLVPSTASLTAARLLAPVAVVGSVACWIAGASAVAGAVAVGASALAVAAVFSAEVGAAFVQASAYGHEQRVALRPPGVLVVGPMPVIWLVAAACLFGGTMLLAAARWIAGGVFTAAGLALAALLAPRAHRLSRRWLVFVPAGVVVHDPIVLADTVMIQRTDVRSLALAPADTQAADLTGTALGPAIEVTLANMSTVVLAPTRDTPRGRALHVQAFIISPSRPGRAVAAARSAGIG